MSDTPRQLNAAQMAARKIKAPTRRTKPSSNHGGGDDGNQPALFAPMPTSNFGAQSAGMFGGSAPSANNSFNFAAPLQANFGGSLSFPPSSTASAMGGNASDNEEAARRNKPFQMTGFGSGAASPAPQAGGGMFGQSAAAPSNPFSSTPQPQAPSSGFSFGASSNQPTSNPFSFGQSAQAPPATGGFTFGQSTAQAAPANNPFQTSQAPSSTPGLSFGSTAPTTQAPGGFSFTASQPAAQAANPFQSFGNGAPAEKPATPSFTFGQTQPQGGSQAGSLPGSQTPSRAESPAFNFGAQTPAANKPAGGAFTFGQSQAQTATPAQTQAPNLFGQPTPGAAAPSNLFGQPTPAAAAPVSNMFGKPAGQEAAAPLNPFAPTGGNPFANIKIPDAATSPAPSSNFFGSQTSRSVSPEKDMSGTESAAEPTPSLFGSTMKQPTIANDLFKVQAEQPAPSPAKSIFGNFGAATTPAKPMFGGQKTDGASLFGSQTPKAAPPATDLFGKPKAPEAPKAAASPFGKPADAIKIFSQPEQRNGSIDAIDNANEKPLANGNTALSEINNGAKSPSRNASTLTSKLGEINSSTRFNPPTTSFQQQTKSPSRTNQTFQFTPTTTSTELVKLPDTSIMDISDFQKVVLERAEEYDENEFFTKAHKTEIARIVAKYFPPTLSPRQQLEAYAAIQIKALKKRAEIDMENATQPAKKMRIKEQLEDWEEGVKQWSVVQAKRVEKRKADSLTDDAGMNGEGSNKRQKPAEPKVQKAAAPMFGSPAKSNSEKAPLPNANKPKVPSSLKNVFTPKPTEATPPKPTEAAPKPAEAAPTPTPKAKRKADVQLTKDDPTGDESTPKNGKVGSATSSLFRNIVGSTPTSTPEKPMFSLTKTADDKPRANPFASLKLPPKAASTPNGASPLKVQPASATPTPAPAPKAAGGFVFKPTQPASTTSTPAPAPKAAGGFVFKPTQPAAGGSTDFMSQFAKSAKKTADAAMEKAKDEDWDEDDETEAEWEKRYQKELAEKREALKHKPALAVPTFGSAASTPPAQSPAAKGPTGGNDGLTSSSRSGTSSPNSVLNEYVPGSGRIGSKLGNPFAHLSDASSGKGNDADDDSDGAPAPTPKAAGSLFSRVSRGTPATASGGSSIFGSVASSPAAEPVDKTWNADTPIKFGASGGAKSNLFGSVSGAASPAPASLFGSPAAGAASPAPMFGKHAVTGSPAAAASPAPLFGKYAVTPAAPAFGASASSEAKDKPTMGFSFGSGPALSAAQSGAATPTAPKSAAFSFLSNGGGLGPTPSLGASRATTPGVTTENESTADEAVASHDGNEPGEELPQKDLASGNEPGEETLVLTKVKARMMTPEKKWGPSTVGTLKLLRNEKTSSVRYLIRLPNGSVGMNKAFVNSKPRLMGKSVAVIMMADKPKEGESPMTTVSLATDSEAAAKKLFEAIEKVIVGMESKA
ncbi:hypothetical protein VF21_01310 [Pseudogymnoascus sp. 05NY08]|nr:hypothetical protein VF21_01310 [Pseudogymnoascus sp. 05NY08]